METVPHRPATPPRPAFSRATPLAVGFAMLVAVTGLAALLLGLLVRVNAGATDYIIGEGHWSKAQQESVASLYRYAQSGDRTELARARAALRVPLGDRAARLALEHDPADADAARAGFIAGGNAPEDIDRLIWMYRHFAGAPYFRESVRLWRLAEQDILRLQRLAGDMETAWMRGKPGSGAVAAYQRQLLDIDRRLRPAELAFSQSLRRGAQAMRTILMVTGVAAFVMIALGAARVLQWSLHRVRLSEGAFSAAFHQANVGMLKARPDGRVVEANDAACRIFGTSRDLMEGRPLSALLHPEDRATLCGNKHLHWGALDARLHRFLRDDGTTLWGRWSTTLVTLGDGAQRVFLLIEDVSEAQALAQEVQHQATHDDLTGLINRREIGHRLQAVLDSARRSGTRHSLCFIDLDQFKLVNDTCGHAAGDLLLRQTAAAISAQLRATDWLGRLGGDEFAILLRDTPLHGAECAAAKISEAVASTGFNWGERLFGVTCSIGIVEICANAPDVGWLLRAADTACYLAKEAGRNRIRTYRETDAALMQRVGEMEWVGEIRRAISERRLLLYAQRIVGLVDDSSLRYEVLVRLVDTAGKIYLPGAFLGAAERYDQATAIDRLVVAMLLEQLAQHPAHVHVLELCHINLSAQSIASPEFREYVIALLDASSVPAQKLCFEITETAAISNLAEAQAFIAAMRSRGARIALDDFGSGLASFAYLKNLDVDILKIDGVFVRDMVDDAVDCALVRSIREVGHVLGKQTVAEWAESERALALLQQIGVDFAQGEAVHVPCPLAELIAAGERVEYVPPRVANRLEAAEPCMPGA